jgi:hypothetical protein
MMSTNQKFRDHLGGLFSEMSAAVNGLADTCNDDKMRYHFLALKGCLERATSLCRAAMGSEGEKAPEFASADGEVPVLKEL